MFAMGITIAVYVLAIALIALAAAVVAIVLVGDDSDDER